MKKITTFLSLLISVAVALDNPEPGKANYATYHNYNKVLTSKDSTINFRYNRNSVKVYLYPQTDSVNLLVTDAEIRFKFATENNAEFVINNDDEPVEIIGVANVVRRNDYDKGLEDCTFFVADKQSGRIFKDKFHQVIERFLADQLCASIGAVSAADLALAQADPRDFGPVSVKLFSIENKFPRMTAAARTEPEYNEKIDNVASTIIKEVAQKFDFETRGRIRMPNNKYNLLSATDGSFSGLNNLRKLEETKIQVDRSQNAVSFLFRFAIPEGQLVYRNLNGVFGLPFDAVLCDDVRNMVFTVGVRIDYKQNHCDKNLIGFSADAVEAQRTYYCKSLGFFDRYSLKTLFNNNAINTAVVRSIEQQLKNKVETEIRKLKCENLKFSKYHF